MEKVLKIVVQFELIFHIVPVESKRKDIISEHVMHAKKKGDYATYIFCCYSAFMPNKVDDK